MTSKRQYMWNELSWPEIKAKAKDDKAVVLLTVGAMEQHGHHLPVDVDTSNVMEIAQRVGERLDKVMNLLVLPTVWVGTSFHHMSFPGTITLRQSTFVDMLTDIGASVAQHGFKKLVIFDFTEEISKSGVTGDATLGTAEKGRLITESVVENLANFLQRLSHQTWTQPPRAFTGTT